MKKLIRAFRAIALGMGTISAAHLALAQTPAAPPTPPEQPAIAPGVPEQTLERIEVTGSLIKRIEGETALPVAVISKEEIQQTGVTNVEQLMALLPVFSSAANTVSGQNAGATTGGLSAISLRGLGSTRTLVLINGRRAAPYGITTDSTSVDVNTIPIAAIDRIEILKEGASATYGSDAIAGVVNFILRTNYQGVEATAQYGDSTRGGGSTEIASLAYGFGDLAKDRFNVLLTATFERDEELWGKDRNFASNGIANPLYDWTSRNTYPANITPLSGNLAGGRLNPGYPNNCAPSINDPNFATGTNFAQCRFDPSPYVPLIPQQEHANFYSAFSYALTHDLTAYAEVSYNRTASNQLEQPSPISGQFALPPGNPLNNLYPYNQAGQGGNAPLQNIYLAPGTPYYPTAYLTAAGATGALPILDVNYRTFTNGGRGLEDISQTPRFVLGIKGTQWGWDNDTSYVHTTNEVRELTTSGYFINSLMLPMLNGQNPSVGYYNLLWPAIGPQPSAAQVAALRSTNFDGTTYVNKTGLDDLTTKWSHDLATLPGGPMSLGLGAEGRHEKYESDPNAYLQVGDISGYGGNFLPAHASRNMYAAFAEVDAPFLKTFEADASLRFDHYETVGSKTTPKVGLRWQPAREVLFRGSWGKGFRAPSLTDLYSPQVQSVTTSLRDPADCVGSVGAGCNVQVTSILGGNPNLKPETSTNISYGVVLEPTKNISASIDFFNIMIHNVIDQGGLNATFIFSNLATWGNLVTRGALDPALSSVTTAPCPCYVASSVNQLNINLGSERVSGFDLDFRYLFPTAPETGKVTFTLHGTYYSKFQIENPDGSYTDQIDTANQTASANGGIIPRWRHRAEIDWQKSNWDVLFAQNWQGAYQDIGSDITGQMTTVGTYETYDLNVGYAGFRNWKLNLGVKNVFDRDPPFTGAGGALYFQNGYDPSYADPRGRFIYLAVGYKFK